MFAKLLACWYRKCDINIFVKLDIKIIFKIYIYIFYFVHGNKQQGAMFPQSVAITWLQKKRTGMERKV